MIPKRKYSTATHLCQESRRVNLSVMEREQEKEKENGTVPYYCIGCSSRPFDAEIDTFWFSQDFQLQHHLVLDVDSVIGNCIHTIKNLALSSDYIDLPTPGVQGLASFWNTFRWWRFCRFVSLRRVDIVFGVACIDKGSKCRRSCSCDDLDQWSDLRLEKWKADS